MDEAQIKYMVDRFLMWKLPENFSPDGGISFKPTFNDHLPEPMKHNPTGTNVFDATQADMMIRYMLEGLSRPAIGDLEPALRAYHDEEISGGRLREIIRSWLDAKPYQLPDRRAAEATPPMKESKAMSAANLAPDIMNELAQLRRELAALRAEAASPATGWRPIETAPKDQVMIMTIYADGHLKVWRGDVLESGKKFVADLPGLELPTHWMPLPSPPPSPPNTESGK